MAALLARAVDRRALSDELHFAARTPDERRHLDHGRANLLRALDIPSGATVLELGAECGALTRYLGEHAASVDAVEPDPGRAEIAKARTHDLGTVRVLAEMPPGEYDLAILACPGPLPTVRARAVCVTAPDRLARREAEDALRAAGFGEVTALSCFPDPVITRAVLTEELGRAHPRLARALGLRDDNGFLLVAGAGTLWPPDRLATYFNTAERAAVWCTRGDVVRTPGGTEVRRSPLLPGATPVDGVAVRACTDAVHDAPTIVEVLLDEPWRAEELLTAWRALLTAEAPRVGAALWDLVPHNVLVDGATLYPIDLEWEHSGAGVAEVTERGLLVLAHILTSAGWRGAAGGGTTRELAGWLGVLLGLPPSFVDDAVARESRFATIGACGAATGTAEIHEAVRAVWERRLEERVASPAGKDEEATR